jgi:SAM-dependent methyltransferase
MKITQNDLARFVPCLRHPGLKTLLHVGCGTAPASRLPDCFRNGLWKEIRLDVDSAVKPDIIANLTDMSVVEVDSVDAVWSSHNIEHLEDFEVPIALSEIKRVLKPGGFALITLPDLEAIAKLIAAGKTDEVIYVSPAGPITPIDMLFGHQKSIEKGSRYMAHRTGFSSKRLANHLISAGFSDIRVLKGYSYDIWAIAVKSD